MATAAARENLVHLNEYYATNTGTSSSRYDKAYKTFDQFVKDFQIIINNIDTELYTMEFDMIHIDVSIANAFRRILIAEVPTMAIDKVYMYNNTSVIQDEVLAHRLGLVPIKADPRLFEYRREGDDEGTPEDTIEFELKIKYSKGAHTKDSAMRQGNHYSVYTSDLKFVPKGEQQRMYHEIRPVHEDILLAKLRPEQEIDLKAHCLKGIGHDHAKFSPVATATYRLLPEITLLEEVDGERAKRLAHCFSEDVIELVEKNGMTIARVANPRKDTGSRNVFCDEDLKGTVNISKVKDHFIFSIESTGILSPDVLFLEAVGVLKEKCRYFLSELKSLKIGKGLHRK